MKKNLNLLIKNTLSYKSSIRKIIKLIDENYF